MENFEKDLFAPCYNKHKYFIKKYLIRQLKNAKNSSDTISSFQGNLDFNSRLENLDPRFSDNSHANSDSKFSSRHTNLDPVLFNSPHANLEDSNFSPRHRNLDFKLSSNYLESEGLQNSPDPKFFGPPDLRLRESFNRNDVKFFDSPESGVSRKNSESEIFGPPDSSSEENEIKLRNHPINISVLNKRENFPEPLDLSISRPKKNFPVSRPKIKNREKINDDPFHEINKKYRDKMCSVDVGFAVPHGSENLRPYCGSDFLNHSSYEKLNRSVDRSKRKNINKVKVDYPNTQFTFDTSSLLSHISKCDERSLARKILQKHVKKIPSLAVEKFDNNLSRLQLNENSVTQFLSADLSNNINIFDNNSYTRYHNKELELVNFDNHKDSTEKRRRPRYVSFGPPNLTEGQGVDSSGKRSDPSQGFPSIFPKNVKSTKVCQTRNLDCTPCSGLSKKLKKFKAFKKDLEGHASQGISSTKTISNFKNTSQTFPFSNSDNFSASLVDEWVPVRPEPSITPESFFPVSKNRIYPWTSSCNLFLQDESSQDLPDLSEQKNDDDSHDKETSEITESTKTYLSSQSKLEASSGISSSLKPATLNPFKMASENSISEWPTEEAQGKPILAPARLGATAEKYHFEPHKNKSKKSTSQSSQFESPSKSIFKFKPSVLANSTIAGSGVSEKRHISDDYKEEIPATNNPFASSFKSLELDEGQSSKRVKTNENDVNSDDRDVNSDEPSSDSFPFSSSSSNGSPKELRVTNSREPTETLTKIDATNCGSSEEATSKIVPQFVPLTNDSSDGSRMNGINPASKNISSSSFVFGQNLQNRVSGVSSSDIEQSRTVFSNGEASTNIFTAAASGLSQTSESGIFGAAAQSTTTSAQCNDSIKSLSETAREHTLREESLKTKYDEVPVVTGEEDEKNVIQMNCKLYSWQNGTWQERGRGILRVNDREIRDELHSRLVIRMQGTLTVMVNAKIWSEMSIEKPNSKSVRFTATDCEGLPKIYLVMGTPKDITLLHNSLEYRVAAARCQNEFNE